MPRTIFENIVIQVYQKEDYFPFCQYTSIRFFEILFFEAGHGQILINQHRVPYQGGALFIFIPNDEYTIEVKEATSVRTIKFLNKFFMEDPGPHFQEQRKAWIKKIETIFYGSSREQSILFSSDRERISVRALFEVLYNEFEDQSVNSDQVLRNSLEALLHVVSRNIQDNRTGLGHSKAQEMVNYIHFYIHEPDKLRRSVLAEEFNLAEKYVSQYFKKHTGLSLKKYILNHKVRLAEHRLRFTDLSLAEIAQELGFTDNSHLDKTFLAYTGLTANAYRMQCK